MEHLHVPRFIDDLSRAVELPIEELHRFGDLCCGEERSLLAVEKLTELPAQQVGAETPALFAFEPDAVLGEDVEAEKIVGDDGHLWIGGVDGNVPRKPGLPVPLTFFRAPIELEHFWLIAGVAPIEVRIVRSGNTCGRSLLAALEDEPAHTGRTEAGHHLGIAHRRHHFERFEVWLDAGANLGGEEVE